MKKIFKLCIVLGILVSVVACSKPNTDKPNEGGNVKVETLKIQFVPSKNVDDIVTTTDPLKDLLKTTLATKGFDVTNVEVTVSDSYEAAGEALSTGAIDLAFIPAGTYVLYHEDGAELLLAATRAGLSKDSAVAKDWNDGQPTTGDSANQVTYYRSLLIAGPSAIGKELSDKVNAGTALTWEDVNKATWCHSSPTSSAGYIYPTIWLQDNFSKKITDLEKAVQTTGYGDTATRLANGQCDIGVGFADFRRDFEANWTTDYGRKETIWAETNVIGVTDGIMNDTISYSKHSTTLTADLIKALQEAFIEIAQTDAGKEVIKIYSHEGYTYVKDADYDSSRKAQELAQGK